MRPLALLVSAALGASASNLLAQSHPPFQIQSTEVRRLHSMSVGVDYELHIAFPLGVDRSELTELPVLLLLDSNDDFPLVTTLARKLQDSGDLPPQLVVGIGYPEYPRYYRSRDYTPTKSGEEDSPSGGGPAFLAFIRDELLPYLVEEFSASEHRVIMGHSLGGLFCLYAIRTEPTLFSAAVISSPAAWWDDEVVFTDWPVATEGTAVYTSLGGEETELMRVSWERLAEVLAQSATSDSLRSDLIADESHSTVKAVAYGRGLRWVGRVSLDEGVGKATTP